MTSTQTLEITNPETGEKTKNTIIKKSAKKLVLKASLKNNKAIKGEKVTFKFNGENYKAKTNSKGITKVTIKKNVIQNSKKVKHTLLK